MIARAEAGASAICPARAAARAAGCLPIVPALPQVGARHGIRAGLALGSARRVVRSRWQDAAVEQVHRAAPPGFVGVAADVHGPGLDQAAAGHVADLQVYVEDQVADLL